MRTLIFKHFSEPRNPSETSGSFLDPPFLHLSIFKRFWIHLVASLFFEIEVLNGKQRHDLAPKINLLDDTFPTSYYTPKTEIVCKSYDPGKLMY
jgi:hypothetical protein